MLRNTSMLTKKEVLNIIWIHHVYLDIDLYSTFPLLIIDQLRKKGCKVRLIVPSFKKRALMPLYNNMKQLPTIRSPMLSGISFFFLLLFYLPRIIKKERPNVIIANVYDWPGMITALLLRNTKFIIDVRSSPIDLHDINSQIMKIYYNISISFAKYFCNGITVTSSALKEELCQVYKLDPHKVCVITNGVSLDIFSFERNNELSKTLKNRLNISEKYIVLYHGSYGDKRGLMETIEGILRLKQSYPDILFFMLGSGPTQFTDRLRSFIKKEHLEDNVYIHEPVIHEKVPMFILMCDVAIAPLDTYSYPRTSCPIKLLECLAMDKTVIITNIPFAKEICTYGNCCILIPSNKSDVIASAIEYTYRNRYLLERMGKTGRSIIEKYYTWLNKASDLEKYIRTL